MSQETEIEVCQTFPETKSDSGTHTINGQVDETKPASAGLNDPVTDLPNVIPVQNPSTIDMPAKTSQPKVTLGKSVKAHTNTKTLKNVTSAKKSPRVSRTKPKGPLHKQKVIVLSKKTAGVRNKANSKVSNVASHTSITAKKQTSTNGGVGAKPVSKSNTKAGKIGLKKATPAVKKASSPSFSQKIMGKFGLSKGKHMQHSGISVSSTSTKPSTNVNTEKPNIKQVVQALKSIKPDEVKSKMVSWTMMLLQTNPETAQKTGEYSLPTNDLLMIQFNKNVDKLLPWLKDHKDKHQKYVKAKYATVLEEIINCQECAKAIPLNKALKKKEYL